MKDETIIEEAIYRLSLVEDAEVEQRERMTEELRFYTGQQWPQDILKQRQLDGRPALVINKLPAYVRQVVNDIRQMRPAIKVRPLDSESDPDTANALNGIIRAIEQYSSAASAYDWAAECAVKIGVGYWRILTEYEEGQTFDQNIFIRRVRDPFSIRIDPLAENQDASDMRFALIETWQPKAAFEQQYPDATSEWQGQSKAPQAAWFKKDAVRVAEYWVVEEEHVFLSLMPDGRVLFGKQTDALRVRPYARKIVRQYLLTGAEVLAKTVWPGQYIPIVRVVGTEEFVDGKTVYKGMISDLMDSQRQYNYMRSASAERIALAPRAPFIGPKGAFKDPKWKYANVKNFPYLEFDGNIMPQRQPGPDASTGLIAEATAASDELKEITGIYNSALGAPSNEISGVAIDQRKKESDVSNFHYMDNLAKAMEYSGKILVDLIPHIYKGERVVRILGPMGEEESITLNQPFVDEKTGEPKVYDLAAGKYDVAVDIGPSYTTQRQETAKTLLEILKIRPDAGELLGDIIAKNLDLPDSDEIVKRLRAVLPAEVVKGENAQIANVISQYEQALAQSKQQIEQLNAVIGDLTEKLNSRKGDLLLKAEELKRKYTEMAQDFYTKLAELELEYQKELPGGAVLVPPPTGVPGAGTSQGNDSW